MTKGTAHALVTGAAGFIGSHLSERLLVDGYQVTGLDSFSDHYQRNLKHLNLWAIAKNPRFELVEADLTEYSVQQLVSDADVVFHLAARPGVRDSWTEFNDYVQANIVGSRMIFDAAATAGTKVVYASSSSVYGDATSLPVTEHHPLKPISPYGASKVMTEILAGAYAAAHGLDAVGLRYFTVYGPRQRPDMAISRFIAALADGKSISVYGDGLQRRDMTYVGDIVEATILAADRGRPGAVYNIASGTPNALIDILNEVGRVLAMSPQLAFENPKPGDVRDTWGDITLATSDLAFRPRVTLREGLECQVKEAERRRAATDAQGPYQPL